ncbi:hypothetical protein A3H87_01305 [Candidatus Curtissbacteria bacterium RIFCSPLOWO2_02_FULL_42_37]|nr:MAG: hypothetical protein A3E71_02640 [Candidatus Curtissbacteria bacterium RIFCSPHIGHO2_12_FULL_42_33]OGE10612.1 MAG: hypothetical protein A3H87_01305 [Candidatus Curtissbacteria bacterium RIFCSPLOWO2_02_FULL_42_37]
MVTYSIINKSKLEGALRLDAEYYQPEFIEITERINLSRNVELKELTVWIKKGIFDLSPDNYRDDGIPLIRTLGINDPLIDFSETVFLDINTHQNNKTTTLFPGDLVFTKIGANIGKSAVLPSTFEEYNFSQNVAGARVKQDIIKSGYLLAYLLSKFGKGQIDRAQMISGQSKLELEDLRKLKIVVAFDEIQQEIDTLIIQAQDQKTQSIRWHQEAEDLLLEELGLKDFQVKDDLSFVVNLSDVKSANRIDANFFHPKYNEVIKRLEANHLDSLEANFEIIRSKNFEYDEEGEAGVIKTKQLGKQFINFEVDDRVGNEVMQKEKLPKLEDSDVIFASMGVGSLGKTNIYYAFESVGKYTIDSTLRIFRKRNNGKVLPEVLAIYLSSWVGQELIYKYIVGTSGIISIYENYLQNFVVPILLEPIQQKIADLMRKSHEARKKSKQLLEEAKRKVEEIIEKGATNG